MMEVAVTERSPTGYWATTRHAAMYMANGATHLLAAGLRLQIYDICMTYRTNGKVQLRIAGLRLQIYDIHMYDLREERKSVITNRWSTASKL